MVFQRLFSAAFLLTEMGFRYKSSFTVHLNRAGVAELFLSNFRFDGY